MSSLPKNVIRQRRGCDLNPGSTAPESSTRTTRLPSHTPCRLHRSTTAAAAGGFAAEPGQEILMDSCCCCCRATCGPRKCWSDCEEVHHACLTDTVQLVEAEVQQRAINRLMFDVANDVTERRLIDTAECQRLIHGHLSVLWPHP